MTSLAGRADAATAHRDAVPSAAARALGGAAGLLGRLVVPCLLVAAWETFSRSGFLPPALLPAPSTVIVTLADWLTGFDGSAQDHSGRWHRDALASAWRVLAGYAIASGLGIGLGVAIGWWKRIDTLLDATLQMLRPVPPVSWIPLAIIWFGIADKPAIFLVFLGAFFPVLMNTIHGVKTIDKGLIRAAAMMGARPAQMLRLVVLPAALPSIFAGLRIAIGTAWMLTVTAEMVAVKSGLGYVLWDSYYFLRYDLVLAAMISIGVMGFVSDYAIRRLSGALLHWQRASTARGGH